LITDHFYATFDSGPGHFWESNQGPSCAKLSRELASLPAFRQAATMPVTLDSGDADLRFAESRQTISDDPKERNKNKQLT
jgi:hypothetical protein